MDTQSDEFLVLTDEEGNFYAVPRATLDGFRVPEAEKAAWDAALGDEVVGYLMGHNTFATDQLARTYQAERQETGARERMLHAAAGDEAPAAAPPVRGGSLVGRFIRLARAGQPRIADAT